MPKIPKLMHAKTSTLIQKNLAANHPYRIFFPKVTKMSGGLHIEGEMEVWNENEVAMKNLVGFTAEVPATYPDSKMKITTGLPQKRAERLEVPEFIEEAVDEAIDNAKKGKIIQGD